MNSQTEAKPNRNTRRRALAALGAVVAWLACDCARAFEVHGRLVQLNQQRQMLVVSVGGSDTRIRFVADVQVLDSQGRELKEGLQAKQLQPGKTLDLTVEENSDRIPVVRVIRIAH
ncbi:MAG: hypothetical protein JSS27_20650 [Planctomycetes bacterium]|nr:hypothetical protein [Planctomycetota bacterium]